MHFELKKIAVKWPVAIILWLSAFIIYCTLSNHVLFYFDQHHLFIYTQQYISRTIESKGFMELCSDFLGQFFHLPLLGSALLATILVGIYIFADFLLGRLSATLETKKKGYANLFSWMRWLQLPFALAIYVFFTFTTCNDTPSTYIVTFVVTGILALFALFLKKGDEDYGKKPLITGVVCAALFCVIAGYQYHKHYNIQERIMVKTQQYAEDNDWDKVIDYTATSIRSGHNNILIAYYRSLALAEKGKLAEAARHALQGSPDPADFYLLQMGEKALFFPWGTNSRETEHGGLVYQRLGLVNEAQHWETEALQAFGITATHLIRLAEYAIATKRPKVAEHFIEPLRHTLFYHGKANELERIKNSGTVEGLPNAFANVSDNTSAPFSNVFHLAPQLEYALSVDSTNALVKEYARTLELVTEKTEE